MSKLVWALSGHKQLQEDLERAASMVPADLPKFKVFRVQESLEFPDEAIPDTPRALVPVPNVDMDEDICLASLGENAIANCPAIEDVGPKGEAEAACQPAEEEKAS